MYSLDPYFMEQPDVLQDIAWGIYSYKGQDLNSVPDEWKEVARVITDEYDRTDFTFTLSSNGRSVEYHMIPQ